MAPALRADRLAAEGAVGQRLNDGMRAVGVVEGSHDPQAGRLAADGAPPLIEVGKR